MRLGDQLDLQAIGLRSMLPDAELEFIMTMPAEGEYEKDALGRLKEEIESLESQIDDASDRLTKLGGA